MQKKSKNKENYQKVEKNYLLEKQQNIQELTRQNTGITLIALCITIIVILILASITIGTLLDNNGIIEKSQSSKENAEQQSERVAVEQAVTSAMTQDRYGKVEEEILKEELKNSTEGTKIETYDDIFWC